MAEIRRRVFILWDRRTAEVQTILQDLASRPPEGIDLAFAEPGWTGGDQLDRVTLPGIRSADSVLVIHPPDTTVVPVAFEMGMAIAFGKPIAILEQPSAPAVYLSQSVRRLFGVPFPEVAVASSPDRLREKLPQTSFWYQVPLQVVNPTGSGLYLCPRLGIGALLRETMQSLLPDWAGPDPRRFPAEMARLALGASQLLWILPPAPVLKQWENVLSALASGLFYAHAERQRAPRLKILRHRDAPELPILKDYCRDFSNSAELRALVAPGEVPAAFYIESLEIRNLKNISHLRLDFTARPNVAKFFGDWTCIAGLNGSGKSTVLQALTMVLLGDKRAQELGGDRIKGMLRRVGEETLPAEINAVVNDGQESIALRLPLGEQGVDDNRIDRSAPDHQRMSATWERLRNQVIVSYGASRNLSDNQEDRFRGLNRQVRRQMTLFDPQTQVASAEVLLKGTTSSRVLRTLRNLLEAVLATEIAPFVEGDRPLFRQTGVVVEAIDLPDGFRSTVAWLADLCNVWHDTAPQEADTSDLTRMRGIVLLDELDLHLHPGLQRSLVPRLRAALPNVQFFTTTHSPLVLSSFDRAELVVLDRTEAEGIRELDRQIFGFSADQIYEYLMETPPQGMVIEEALEEGNDPDLALYLLQSEEHNEEMARVERDNRRRLVEELLGKK